MSYQDAKLNNKEMSQAKKTFKKQIEMAGKGRWVESDLKQSTYVFRNWNWKTAWGNSQKSILFQFNCLFSAYPAGFKFYDGQN